MCSLKNCNLPRSLLCHNWVLCVLFIAYECFVRLNLLKNTQISQISTYTKSYEVINAKSVSRHFGDSLSINFRYLHILLLYCFFYMTSDKKKYAIIKNNILFITTPISKIFSQPMPKYSTVKKVIIWIFLVKIYRSYIKLLLHA